MEREGRETERGADRQRKRETQREWDETEGGGGGRKMEVDDNEVEKNDTEQKT